MKKPFYSFALLCLSLFPCNLLFSQTASPCREVLASAGGNAFVGGKNFEFTLGEPVIETIGLGANLLTQGFHQPEICPLTVGISEVNNASGLSVFPNPTTGELYLRFDAPTGKTFQVQVFNAAGQLVRDLPKSDDTKTNIVDCRAFPPSTYFLLARTDDGSLFFQVPFVKSDR
ncbi:MAG: T9SS type A sorting domain-containing protein [Phycisphaerae bacterium]|nr:T9SS type A sorting domain-containing protein [Saprospiraceae bacterium]